jgi:hypothetical protein
MKLSYMFITMAMALFLAAGVTAQSVQTGTFTASESTPNYTLAAGSGDRTVSIDVKFDKPFAGKPQIVLGVTTVDAAKEGNLRYDVKADAVTASGFTLQLKTWSDTKIFTLGGTWLAVEAGKAAAPAQEPPKKAKKGKK